MEGLEMIPYEWRMGGNFVPYEGLEEAIFAAADAKRAATANETPPPYSPPVQSE